MNPRFQAQFESQPEDIWLRAMPSARKALAYLRLIWLSRRDESMSDPAPF